MGDESPAPRRRRDRAEFYSLSLNTEKANEMLNIIKDNPEFSELTVLLKRDCLKGKYVIHFGI